MPVEIFPPDFLFESFLKLVIDFFPNVESYEWAKETYRSTALVQPGIDVPPERVKLVLQRYFDYPDFYSAFAARALAPLPQDDTLRRAIVEENADLAGAIQQVLVPVTVLSVFPLPVFEDLEPVAFAEARHTFELQLRYSQDLFPQNPTATFLIYYWICGVVASRMLTAYFADQIARIERRAPRL